MLRLLLLCKHQVKVLRAKYNDLVAFTVNLTAEKDLIQRSLDTTKEDLQREIGTRRHLEQQCKYFFFLQVISIYTHTLQCCSVLCHCMLIV
jgi:hypothetical protein